MPLKAIEGRSRKQHIAHARFLAVYLCRRLTAYSFPTLADYFRRDHSTLVHAEQVAKNLMRTDSYFAAMAQKASSKLRAQAR